MSGLYSLDGSFRSKEEISADLATRDQTVIYHTPFSKERDFDWWQTEMIRRRDGRLENEGFPELVEIDIMTDKPIVVAQMGDHHIAGLYHNYELMGRHSKIIKEHPSFYVALGGDLVDMLYWNPGQDENISSFEEQQEHARQMMNYMGKDKILWANAGDHEQWESKTGGNFYTNFQRNYEAYLLHGTTKVQLKVGNQTYRIVTAHRLPGFSMYNNLHPTMRSAHFGLQGADVYVSYHTHRKGLGQKVMNTFEGPIRQLYVTPGPYKYSDEYGRKLGLGRLTDEELGAAWLVFFPDVKKVEAYWDVESAVERVAPYLK